ncbi:Vesicle transport through interaction with t-SNAREs 1A [Pitangus sulphuratus]|nr:Vesicle transport through interaction with t-SNAREs 1A [Pitangus sulphuratus]
MSADFESYEQDFAVLTADITGRIGKVPKLVGDEKKQMVANVEKQLEEARELLEQMELEVREIPPQSRGMYSSRMRSYKQEMGKLEADFKRSRIAYSDEVRNELLGDDGNSSENQRAHLLDNTERLERSSRRLEAGYQIAVETDTPVHINLNSGTIPVFLSSVFPPKDLIQQQYGPCTFVVVKSLPSNPPKHV